MLVSTQRISQPSSSTTHPPAQLPSPQGQRKTCDESPARRGKAAKQGSPTASYLTFTPEFDQPCDLFDPRRFALCRLTTEQAQAATDMFSCLNST